MVRPSVWPEHVHEDHELCCQDFARTRRGVCSHIPSHTCTSTRTYTPTTLKRAQPDTAPHERAAPVTRHDLSRRPAAGLAEASRTVGGASGPVPSDGHLPVRHDRRLCGHDGWYPSNPSTHHAGIGGACCRDAGAWHAARARYHQPSTDTARRPGCTAHLRSDGCGHAHGGATHEAAPAERHAAAKPVAQEIVHMRMRTWHGQPHVPGCGACDENPHSNRHSDKWSTQKESTF